MVLGKIEIEGCQIAYTEAGSDSNPPVLLLHGITSHRGVWSRTLVRLQQDFHCIAIDHLGFGDSDKPKDADYSIQKQAERALKVADHFGFDRFILIGHSMGGQIATYLAASFMPQRVSKLVSMDGVVTGKLSDVVQKVKRLLIVVGQYIPSLLQLMRILCRSKTFACWVFDHWFYKPEELPFADWEIDRRYAMNPNIIHSTIKAWESLNATNLTPILKNIAAPTLVIFGKQDGTVPVKQAHLFKEQLSSAQLVLIDQCGHFPMYEKFDEYFASLQKFLTQGV
ncbi:4,5:9,10-diseco-3-hydroxy-5,9, 17-trioxoandrosta-1(10),2-diene-4-oate hydrolase [Anaerolineales bacterium]|nr:4,5:9,10-diseco-3-hydroxy-5,9, 17-trioxoandrosta-1(10),2-diene-4-oate hydrolase [Anaerolineales bacterium]